MRSRSTSQRLVLRGYVVAAALLVAPLATLACSTTTTTPASIGQLPATAIGVDPSFFMGSVACSDAPGAMQSYVVTLTDLSALEGDARAPFVLPSSPPTPCSETAWFSYVVAGDSYLAEIDGYEQPANGARDPDGGLTALPYAVGFTAPSPVPGDPAYCSPELSAVGSRQMCDVTTHLPVAPRWRATCPAQTDAGVGGVSIANFDVILRDCSFLEPQAATGPTIVRIDPSSILGSLDCGSLLALDITTQGASILHFSRATDCTADTAPCCPSVVSFSPTPGLAVDTPYTFTVTALVSSDGGSPTAETSGCYATAKPHGNVLAACDPLVASR